MFVLDNYSSTVQLYVKSKLTGMMGTAEEVEHGNALITCGELVGILFVANKFGLARGVFDCEVIGSFNKFANWELRYKKVVHLINGN